MFLIIIIAELVFTLLCVIIGVVRGGDGYYLLAILWAVAEVVSIYRYILHKRFEKLFTSEIKEIIDKGVWHCRRGFA